MRLKSLIITASILGLLSLFAWNQKSLAAVRCETQYGGGQVCVTTGELQINKKVKNPSSNDFVDNLTLGDKRFAPGEEVTFKLIIKNVGDAAFGSVHVVDSLPGILERTAGDLTFDISDLSAGETEEREIRARVISSDRLPSNIVCDVNTAEATSGNNRDKDTAQICAERKVLGAIAAVPVTGPENWLLVFSLPIFAGMVGLALLTINRKHSD